MREPYSFNELYRQLQLRKIPFFVTFFIVMLISYGVLYAIDFIPEPVEETTEETKVEEAKNDSAEEKEETEEMEEMEEVEKVEAVEDAKVPIVREEVKKEIPAAPADELPVSIYFKPLDKEIKVLNPTSSDIASLDNALLSGAIRHPESADFSEDGNIFILAHSSYLPNVLNKNFQAFNDIQKLTWGDEITLRSADMEYTYRVQKVYQDKASEIFVPETPGEARLTLVTCNVLGAKEDRYMVEAELVGSKKLQ